LGHGLLLSDLFGYKTFEHEFALILDKKANHNTVSNKYCASIGKKQPIRTLYQINTVL
jgi:hypothetical protein